MIVYHGSYVAITNPDLQHSRKYVDFGLAFYVTPLYDQANKWSQRFKRMEKKGIVSTYEFDETAFSRLKVLQFDSYTEEWLDFVISCRQQTNTADYDIVIGGIADDKVFNTIELYEDQLITKAEALSRLKYEKPNLQIAFRTEAAIRYLSFVRSEEI